MQAWVANDVEYVDGDIMSFFVDALSASHRTLNDKVCCRFSIPPSPTEGRSKRDNRTEAILASDLAAVDRPKPRAANNKSRRGMLSRGRRTHHLPQLRAQEPRISSGVGCP